MFAHLSSSTRRARSGPIKVSYEPAPTDGSLRAAYAVPRRVGTAVERNAWRRRLRAVVREAIGDVPAGTYLIGAGPGVRDLDFQELRRRVIEAMKRAAGGGQS